MYQHNLSKVKNEVFHSHDTVEIEQKRNQRLMPVQEELAAKQVNYAVKMISGDPGPAIVEYANGGQFDLVIIGSRGLNVLQEFVLGSVSHKVVKRVHCPVMVVK